MSLDFNEHIPLIVRIANSYTDIVRTSPDKDIEDIRQAGLIGAWTASMVYDDSRGMSFRNWLVLKARGAILDEIRSSWSVYRSTDGVSRHREQAHDFDLDWLECPEDTREYLRQEVLRIIQELPVNQKTVLSLCIKGYNPKQASIHWLGVTDATAYSWYNKGINTVKRKLEKEIEI